MAKAGLEGLDVSGFTLDVDIERIFEKEVKWKMTVNVHIDGDISEKRHDLHSCRAFDVLFVTGRLGGGLCLHPGAFPHRDKDLCPGLAGGTGKIAFLIGGVVVLLFGKETKGIMLR